MRENAWVRDRRNRPSPTKNSFTRKKHREREKEEGHKKERIRTKRRQVGRLHCCFYIVFLWPSLFVLVRESPMPAATRAHTTRRGLRKPA